MALLAAATLPVMGATPAARLDVGIDGLRNSKGLVRICLTRNPDSFPDCVGDRDALTRNVAAATRTVRFEGLSPGGYAVAVIHDENGNQRLDTFAGIPREGFGFSRNPGIRFGPPRFTAARFTLNGVADEQRVAMRYFL